MYDPGIGRWLSEDPIGFKAGDPNLYRYVNNDPVGHTDPSGLQIALGLGVAGGLSAAEAAGLFSAGASLAWLGMGAPTPRLPSIDFSTMSEPLVVPAPPPNTTYPTREQMLRVITTPRPPVTDLREIARAAGRLTQPLRPGLLNEPLILPRPARPPVVPLILATEAVARAVEMVPPRRGRPESEGTFRIGEALSLEEAIAAVAAGGDILTDTREMARFIAREAGDAEPIAEGAHERGEYDHFHPVRGGRRTGSHVWYGRPR